jgi:hypothetical protein
LELLSRPTVADGLRNIALWGLLCAGCGIGIHRDLSGSQPQDVVFDDKCGLQEYFDALAGQGLSPPAEISGWNLSRDERGDAIGGTVRFRFTGDFQLYYLRRTLTDNWKRLPPVLLGADPVDLEVRWAQRAGVRRVVTIADALITAGGDSWYLPYHVCLSDLLFGEDLYKTRRTFLHLPPAAPSRFARATGADAGALPSLPAASDAGVDSVADGRATTVSP